MTTNIIREMQSAIEDELKSQVNRINEGSTKIFFEMISYHMGWTGENENEYSRGKRLRPLLLLLSSSLNGSNQNWRRALPGAAAVELIHNFSLIHDDIEDKSDKRRNRPTVWVKWGIPQAINAGDGLYAMSDLAAYDLIEHFPSEIVLKTSRLLHKTCLNLTRGQYMDMLSEGSDSFSLEDYWMMITNKTAALIAASTEIGSILAGLEENDQEMYRQFGHYLGLAFQIKDDILGIWGKEEKTGKSNLNDLVTRKKTLPVLYGLQQGGNFSNRWREGNIEVNEISDLSVELIKEGGLLFAEESAEKLSEMAIKLLQIISRSGEIGDNLFSIVNQLLKRES